MPKYGDRSRSILVTAVPELVDIFEEAIKHVDISILCGMRTRIEQNYLFRTGASKVKWPHSKHNRRSGLAEAVDFAPYPIDWKDLSRFIQVSFFLKGIAAGKGVKLRLGCDWNGNFDTTDSLFLDAGHVELVL